jgi:competence protein ComEC
MKGRRWLPLILLACVALIRVMASKDTLYGRHNYSLNLPFFTHINASIIQSVKKSLPSVHADLLLGMTIGVNEIKDDTRFYNALVQVGLIHVVVVSGYNVALVITFFTSLFANKVSSRSRLFVFVGTVLYTLLCGAQPPVVRAALMGYTAYLAKAEGRAIVGLYLVLTVCCLMLIFNPTYIVSLSFWLSVLATLGLIFFEPSVSSVTKSLFKRIHSKIEDYLPVGDLSTSIACQIVVWPLISYFFGRVGLYSPLYNMLTLWLIPLCTVTGFIFILISQFVPFLSGVAGMLVFPFFDLFVRLVNFLSSIDHGNVSFTLNLASFIGYYAILFIVALVILRSRAQNQ